jgi:hypothetical protein
LEKLAAKQTPPDFLVAAGEILTSLSLFAHIAPVRYHFRPYILDTVRRDHRHFADSNSAATTMAATLDSAALLRAVHQLDVPDGLSHMELEEVRSALRNGRGTLANVLAYPPRRAEDRVAVHGHVVELRHGQSLRLGALDVDNALMLRYVCMCVRVCYTRSHARGAGGLHAAIVAAISFFFELSVGVGEKVFPNVPLFLK